MRIAYFDCFAGAAGDMIVGALIDAGASFDELAAGLNSLGVEGLRVRTEAVTRRGMAGTKFHVEIGHHDHAHRHLHHVVEIIDRSDLPDRAKDRARRTFTRLAEAEAKVHGTTVEKIHFHEVGAIDSIADILGACMALELLGIDAIHVSPIPTGAGTTKCDHGEMPVPPPAVAELLVGAPAYTGPFPYEATTPTAAALFAALAESFGPMPEMDVQAVGRGAGTREGDPLPNILRVFVGNRAGQGTADTVVELSANLDDCTGEMIGCAIEKLLAGGALDAWAAPITTKKSRPGWMLTALCAPASADAAEAVLLAETTTFGVRRRTLDRTKLDRSHRAVETPYGPIRVKIGARGGRVLTASPEFSDCAAAAEAHQVPVKEVLAAAAAAYRAGGQS